MKSLAVLASPLWLLSVLPCLPQSGAVIPQGGAGHATQATCVILKRMGPADQVTSRMYSFGIRGKQFQYVEGKLPEGFPFHGRMTDHDVRNLQARGTEVIVVESHYTAEDLKQARAECRGETGQTPNKAEAVEAPPSADDASGQAAPADKNKAAPIKEQPASVDKPATAKLFVGSTPDGADIEVDGSFVGNAPSDIQVTEGDHTVTVKKVGFKDWQRNLKVSAGSNIRLNAELEKAASQ